MTALCVVAHPESPESCCRGAGGPGLHWSASVEACRAGGRVACQLEPAGDSGGCCGRNGRFIGMPVAAKGPIKAPTRRHQHSQQASCNASHCQWQVGDVHESCISCHTCWADVRLAPVITEPQVSQPHRRGPLTVLPLKTMSATGVAWDHRNRGTTAARAAGCRLRPSGQ